VVLPSEEQRGPAEAAPAGRAAERLELMAPLRLHANLLFYGLDGGTWSDPPPSPTDAGHDGGVGGDEWLDNGCRAWDPHAKVQDLWLGHGQQGLGHSATGLDTIKAVWGSSPREEAANIEDFYGTGLFDGGISAAAVNTAAIGNGHGAVFATEPSMDEASEESEGVQEQCDAYFAPGARIQPQQAHHPGARLSAIPSVLSPEAVLCGAPAAGTVVSSQPAAATEPAAPATSAPYGPYMPVGSFLPHAASAGCGVHGFGNASETGPFVYDASDAASRSTAVTASASTVATSGLSPATSSPCPESVPSIGSYAHLSGQCSRCCFHPKGRCANGFNCQFCHFDHDKRPRNGKKKRYRRRADGTLIESPDE